MHKKIEQRPELEKLIRKDKAIKYAVSRGFESGLIFKVVKELEEEQGY